MKKILLSMLFIMLSPMAFAGTNWSINLGLGTPFYQAAPPAYYSQPPVVVYQQPGYYSPPVQYYGAPPVIIYQHPQSRNYGRGYHKYHDHHGYGR